MYKPSKKTIYLTGAFAAVAGLVGVYSYWNDISYAVCDKVYPEANEGEVRLKDNQGNRYSLLNHGDGKETALYDDNRSVTFHRDNSVLPTSRRRISVNSRSASGLKPTFRLALRCERSCTGAGRLASAEIVASSRSWCVRRSEEKMSPKRCSLR